MGYKKIFSVIVIMVTLSVGILFTGCGVANSGITDNGSFTGNNSYEGASGGDTVATSKTQEAPDDTANTQIKLVWTAGVSYQVANVDEAHKKLKTLLTNGEYLSSTHFNEDESASIIVRVKAERLDEFLDSLSVLGERKNFSVSSEDITVM
jgi:hypothetical protein